jgi:hypothetical protein
MSPDDAVGAYLKAYFRPDNAADLLAAAQPLMAIAWDEAIQIADDEGLLLYHQAKGLKSLNPYRITK